MIQRYVGLRIYRNELQGLALREFSLRSVNGTLCVHELQDYVLR